MMVKEGQYFFDKQLLIDLGVQNKIQEDAVNTSQRKKVSNPVKNSSICKKHFPLEKMREYVGKHILKEDVSKSDPNICGFCGRPE